MRLDKCLLAVLGICALGVASCKSSPKIPVARCAPTGISISNPNDDPLTDLRVTAKAQGDEYLADQWPPIEGKATIEMGVRSFLSSKTHMPLGLISVNCDTVSEIQMTFKINGQQLSMTAQ
jgi:hypothetical protein